MRKIPNIVSAAVLATVVAASVATATALAGHNSTHAKRSHHASKAVPPIAALTAASTALAGVPAGVHAPSPAQRPAPGTVHQLGNGRAFAWIRNGEICWNTGTSFGVSACGSTSGQDLIDVAIYPIIDPWPADPSRSAHVVGIAEDGVSKVVVTVASGSSYAAPVVKNFYDVQLPATIPPWNVVKVQALTAGGAITFSHAVAMRPPSQLHRSTAP